MEDLSVLSKQIEKLRNELHAILSNEELVSRDKIINCSQNLDKLIVKYYNSFIRSGNAEGNIKSM